MLCTTLIILHKYNTKLVAIGMVHFFTYIWLSVTCHMHVKHFNNRPNPQKNDRIVLWITAEQFSLLHKQVGTRVSAHVQRGTVQHGVSAAF